MLSQISYEVLQILLWEKKTQWRTIPWRRYRLLVLLLWGLWMLGRDLFSTGQRKKGMVRRYRCIFALSAVFFFFFSDGYECHGGAHCFEHAVCYAGR